MSRTLRTACCSSPPVLHASRIPKCQIEFARMLGQKGLSRNFPPTAETAQCMSPSGIKISGEEPRAHCCGDYSNFSTKGVKRGDEKMRAGVSCSREMRRSSGGFSFCCIPCDPFFIFGAWCAHGVGGLV